jgi:hypothetical protein
VASLINLANANALAYLALILWFPFSLLIFSTLRPARATLVVVLGGTLFLPEVLNFDFPLLPPFDKNAITCSSALIGILFRARRQFRRAKPFRGIGSLVFVMLGAVVMTTITNRDPVQLADRQLQAMTLGEITSQGVRDGLTLALPFILGRVAFRDSKDLRSVIYMICVFGLLYSLLALVEIRLSPQLHRWVFGYHQHSFSQTFRWGGYRPTIFLAHGIAVGMFFLVVGIAMIGYSRVKSVLLNVPSKLWMIYSIILFIFIKSTGAIAYGMAAFPIALFTRPKTQLRFAFVTAILIAAYPITKVSGVFPEEMLVNIALELSADRADSLQDRFDNDIILANRARERLLWGWGPFGRSRVYDDTGKDISVTDGWWIIQLGGRGAVGLACLFGFLLLPIVYAHRNLKKIPDKKDRMLIANLAIICAVYVLDLLPNGLYNTLPFFLSGALLGVTEGIIAAARKNMPLPMQQQPMMAAAAPQPPIGSKAARLGGEHKI